MFDLAWSEIALIAVVAVVVIGPKDLPDAVRQVAKGVQKLRRMASEFQSQADELVREAKLEDVRDQIRDIRNFDVKGTIERHLDEDGGIRKTFSEDPMKDAWKPGPSSLPPPPAAAYTAEPLGSTASSAAPAEAPAFVPPEVAAERRPPAPLPSDGPAGPEPAAAEPAAPPAMIPPALAEAAPSPPPASLAPAPAPAATPAPALATPASPAAPPEEREKHAASLAPAPAAETDMPASPPATRSV
jgi:sec-independent protein translocase protein TatB